MKEKETKSQKVPDKEQAPRRNYMLLFRTYYGGLLGWNITSSLSSEEIPQQIESAAQEWLLSLEGQENIEKEEITDCELDYANVMMNAPREILAKYNIYLAQSVYEIIELDADEDLLPEELRAKKP